ncbi:MAG: SdpI family protein [Bacteroidota bacterium]
MNWLKRNGLILALMLVPALVILLLWDRFPAEVPIHWNLKGEIDGYAPKFPGLWYGPLAMLVINVIFWLIPVLDPKKNTDSFQKTLNRIQVIFNVFFVGIMIITAAVALGYEVAVDRWVINGVLLLFALLGNYMGKIRPNYFMGIRTPWTLESEDNWVKTHRMAAKLWVGGAIVLMIINMFVSPDIFWPIMMAGVLVMVLIPAGYSLYLYKNPS